MDIDVAVDWIAALIDEHFVAIYATFLVVQIAGVAAVVRWTGD